MIALIDEFNLHTLSTANGIAFVFTDDPRRAILARMKVEINLPEVFSATTIGGVLGLLSFAGHERWVRLGRDAYIAHYAQIFDRQTIHPPNMVAVIIIWVILAIIVLALFKGLASFYKLVSGGSQTEKRAIVPPAKLLVDRSRQE
jgi:hypothetical protein